MKLVSEAEASRAQEQTIFNRFSFFENSQKRTGFLQWRFKWVKVLFLMWLVFGRRKTEQQRVWRWSQSYKASKLNPNTHGTSIMCHNQVSGKYDRGSSALVSTIGPSSSRSATLLNKEASSKAGAASDVSSAGGAKFPNEEVIRWSW